MFQRIVIAPNVPVYLALIDCKTKRISFVGEHKLTDNVGKDIVAIKERIGVWKFLGVVNLFCKFANLKCYHKFLDLNVFCLAFLNFYDIFFRTDSK